MLMEVFVAEGSFWTSYLARCSWPKHPPGQGAWFDIPVRDILLAEIMELVIREALFLSLPIGIFPQGRPQELDALPHLRVPPHHPR